MSAPAQTAVGFGASRLTTAEATLLAMGARGDMRFGTIYPGSRGRGWVIAIYIDGHRERIYGLAGAGFANRGVAEGVLNMIRVAIAQGKSPAEACSPYISRKSPANLVTRRYAAWVAYQEDRAEIGDLSPGTVREHRRYAREGGELEWWAGQSIYDVTTGQLETWSIWLAKRGLAPATRRHVLGALRTCCGWLRRMGALRDLPEWPAIEVPEYSPQIITPRAQDAILETFTEPVEWLSHALAARAGLRSGEVRAISPGDYHPPDDEGVARLSVTKAMKTLSWQGVPGPTKNRRHRTIPIPQGPASRDRGRLARRAPPRGRPRRPHGLESPDRAALVALGAAGVLAGRLQGRGDPAGPALSGDEAQLRDRRAGADEGSAGRRAVPRAPGSAEHRALREGRGPGDGGYCEENEVSEDILRIIIKIVDMGPARGCGVSDIPVEHRTYDLPCPAALADLLRDTYQVRVIGAQFLPATAPTPK